MKNNNLSSSLAIIQQNARVLDDVSNLTNNVATQQTRSAYEMAHIDAQGVMAQLQLQKVNAAATTRADIGMLSNRAIGVQSAKALEAYTFMAATREKMVGLFSSIYDQQTSTVWSRMKQIVQQFKF